MKSRFSILFTLSLTFIPQTWAGLCNDLSGVGVFDLQEVKEYIWGQSDIHNLGTPTQSQSLSSADQIQVVHNSLAYQVPFRLDAGCDWVHSRTSVYKNYGSLSLSDEVIREFYKIRDVQGEDVDNTGGISIGGSSNYWLHQVQSAADTLDDGFAYINDSTVSIRGTYFPESTPQDFDMWYATIFITNSDTTKTSKLTNSYFIRRDSSAAVADMQRYIDSTKYPYPEFKSDFQLIKLSFQHNSSLVTSLKGTTSLASIAIQGSQIQWAETQDQIQVFNSLGQLVHSKIQSDFIQLNHLSSGPYWVKSSDHSTFRINQPQHQGTIALI